LVKTSTSQSASTLEIPGFRTKTYCPVILQGTVTAPDTGLGTVPHKVEGMRAIYEALELLATCTERPSRLFVTPWRTTDVTKRDSVRSTYHHGSFCATVRAHDPCVISVVKGWPSTARAAVKPAIVLLVAGVYARVKVPGDVMRPTTAAMAAVSDALSCRKPLLAP
jgi:hypothetical protein